MPSKNLIIFSVVFSLALFVSSPVAGLELETRYVTIQYSNIGTLRKFNKKLHMGRIGYLLAGKRNETIEDEVRNKIDVIVEKVQAVLDMSPKDMKFRIVICESTKCIQKEYKRIYGIKVNYIAFYSPVEDTVFYSAKNVNLRIAAHEIGHVVAEKYYLVSTPVKIHELIAQYAEMHITD